MAALTREELFALVWDRPVREVARELGISDVGLAKRCRKLQVPTPPRGYWERVRSGQQPKRPPLEAILEELSQTQRGPSAQALVGLSAGQWDILRKALAELKASGVDVSGCRCPRYEVQAIDPAIAAEVILLVQRAAHTWLPPGASDQKQQGSHYCSSQLIAKLLPLAKRQILVLRQKEAGRHSSMNNAAILVRITPAFIEDMAALLGIVRTHRLDHVARCIKASSHVWAARYHCAPDDSDGSISQICVSETELWFRGTWGWGPNTGELETERIRISDIVPMALLEPGFFESPCQINETYLRSYEDRLKAIEFADSLYARVSDEAYHIEDSIPTVTCALMERLWFGAEDGGVFSRQTRQFQKLRDTVEQWDGIIDAEKSALIKEVLGIAAGDNVTFTKASGAVRLRVSGTSMYFDAEQVTFVVSGIRYNKDGLLGQRQESLYVTVPRRP